MSLAITVSQAEQLLRETPFTQSYDFRLHLLSEGECVLDVPFQQKFERPDKIINGSVYMTAADVAMWLAIMTRLGMNERAVTTDMHTSFLDGAIKEDIRCTARVLKLGKRLIYGTAECTSSRGKLLTTHTLTYIRL